jgi:antitoxin component YwqK of YwqJK toxin-antitoxin module
MKKHITYHDNGAKREECYYLDGKKEGECISWFANGEKELIGYFKKGKPCNIWMNWDKDGRYDWIDMDADWVKDCFYHK